MSKELEKVLKESTKDVRMHIPKSIMDVVETYQKIYKLKHGKFISKHNAIVQLMLFGLPTLKKESKEIKKELIKSI